MYESGCMFVMCVTECRGAFCVRSHVNMNVCIEARMHISLYKVCFCILGFEFPDALHMQYVLKFKANVERIK